MKFTTATTAALLSSLFFGAAAKDDADVQKIAKLHRSRHLTASDVECPRDPYFIDVGTSLSTVPVIDGNGDDAAWDKAHRFEMFKAAKYTKMRLGYAYIMFDCSSNTWFVKADLDYPMAASFCDNGDCDHFVKMNGGGVIADPHKDGKYYTNNMGWELSFPASRAPGLGDEIKLQVHANVFEDNESQTASTAGSNNCNLVTAKCSSSGGTGSKPPSISDADVCVSDSPVVGTASSKPAQTFYIPMPEEMTFKQCFQKINKSKAKAPVETLLSVSVSTDKTIVWYDHWEDGYDKNVGKFTHKTTEIWGDGNAANGCAPGIKPCTHAADILKAGQVIVIQNSVNVPRKKTEIRYDGGDKLYASYPIAVTRGAYPKEPGSLMAGAVEVLDTTLWGKTFEAPIGWDVGRHYKAFELSVFFFMASEDKTTVTLGNGKKVVLNEGESGYYPVKLAERVSSDKPIQVDFITGDLNSGYELRWYSLIALEDYSKSYVSPVGDTRGNTKMIVYNPNPKQIRVIVEHINRAFRCRRNNRTRRLTCSVTAIRRERYAINMKAKQVYKTKVVHSGSGAWLDSNDKFIPLSLTDAENYTFDGQGTGGQWYDWGFPVLPRDQLTSQVVIGLGYGCTDNTCGGNKDRSVVWLSPVADADLYIDYQNTGSPKGPYKISQLRSYKITDPKDDDMSGALIYATKRGSGKSGQGVDIAAAWGQDPDVSESRQSISLDLGTVVLPFTGVKVSKTTDKEQVAPGQTLRYTIRVSNVGQKLIKGGQLTVYDSLDTHVAYVPGSMAFSSGGSCKIADNGVFPLANGYKIPFDLPRRGGSVEITFQVRVSHDITQKKVINTGVVEQDDGSKFTYETTTKVRHSGSIELSKKVYIGNDNGAKCGTTYAMDYVEDYLSSPVTYCYRVKNTGLSHLSEIKLSDPDFNYKTTLSKTLAPNEQTFVHLERKIEKPQKTMASVVANPVFSNGDDIDTVKDVSDEDDAEVGMAPFDPKLIVENTVYIGADDGAQCGTDTAVESVKDIFGSAVVHCFKVTNTGNTYLNGVQLRNKALGDYLKKYDGPLAPGQTWEFALSGKITKTLINTAWVGGVPVLNDGTTKIPNVNKPTDTDPAGVVLESYSADIEIQNTVYLGKDEGAKCGGPEAVEFVSDFYGADVTYCFKVINKGSSHLTSIKITNDDLSFNDDSVGDLAPGKFAIVSHESQITEDLTNVAHVVANPITEDGRDIQNLDDVEDRDPSKVGRKVHEPKISIKTNVYSGDSGKQGCQRAPDSVNGYADDIITYCFVVENTGSSYLGDVTIVSDKPAANIKITGLLAPGASKTEVHVDKIVGDLKTTGVVTANPVTEDGEDIPDQTHVKDEDKTSVVELIREPLIEIQNTAFLGDDEGQGCGTDKAVELVSGAFGDEVTYCFEIVNTGNTILTNVKVRNLELSYSDDTTISKLAPGESRSLHVVGSIYKDLTNYAEVVADPAKEVIVKGITVLSLLGMEAVTDNDPSAVQRTAVNPNIDITNKVYIGDDDGESCETAVETVADIKGTPVQYCFVVKNTGDTVLEDVIVVNEDLDFEESIDSLAPGEEKELSVPSTIEGNLRNKAYASGKPASDDGEPIPGLGEVSDCDPSEVQKTEHSADVEIELTVVKGPHDDANCDSATDKVAQGPYGTLVTYCYKVTNNGETTLDPADVSDANVWFFHSLPDPLAPGASVLLDFPSRIEKSMTNVANVTGNPVMDDGRDISDLDDVTSSDSAEVIMTPFAPSVSLSVTSYPGHDDGSSCDTSTDESSGTYGSPVTYCYVATNTGNSSLSEIYIYDEDLDEDRLFNVTLPPGGEVSFSVEKRIMKDFTNTGNVTAAPTLDDGEEIPGYTDVSASDDTSVKIIAHEPAVAIELEVYAGHDEGGKCNTADALDYLEEYPNEPITHCILVTNAGDSYLGNVKIASPEIDDFTKTVAKLAPGESSLIFLPKTMTNSSVNTATVVANPILENGEDIPAASDVTSKDTAEVVQLAYAPEVEIDNTVFIGSTADDKCGTPAARDFVAGLYGTPATYCFVVSNTGDTVLTNIIITNDDLDLTKTVDGALQPGENTTITLGLPITEDLKNMAVVTANPAKTDLTDIVGLNDVSSQDDSAVEKLDFIGGISVDTTVALGSDEASCGTDAALDEQSGIYGTKVIYCIEVKNTGDSYLGEVALVVPALGVDKRDFPVLSPGEAVSVSAASLISKDETVTAKATGNPVTEDGVDIPDLPVVSDEDPANVVKLVIEASIGIKHTVYLGDDLGDSCEDVTTKKVQGNFGEDVVFCLEVENTGESHLDDVTIEVPEISYSYQKPSDTPPMAPGDTFIIPVPRTVEGAVKPDAVVKGNPVLEDGTDIPDLKRVTAADSTEVVVTPHHPAVDIDATVYLGNTDEGASCGTATNYVENYSGFGVTYCFKVTNNGDSFLDDIAVVVPELDFEDLSIVDAPLAPGDSVTIAYGTTIDGELKSIASVTANPTLEDGSDIPDSTNVSDTDDVLVGELEYYPGVSVDNIVYLGDDMGVSCETGMEKVVGNMLDKVTYCFNVTNTGDTFLGSVVLKNLDLGFEDQSIGQLAPGAFTTVVRVLPLTGNLTNVVTVTANPTLASGMDISGAGDVTDSDPSEVAVAPVSGDTRSGQKPQTNSTDCLQDNWSAAGKDGDLVCATKDVFLEAISVKEPTSCTVDETITISIDGSIRMLKSQKFDVGLYIATDGGDALTGTCAVNGLQDGNTYNVVDSAGSSTTVGSVAWTTGGADGDACGDVFTTADASNIDLPVAVDLTVPCKDENEDGILDIAICFTWKCDATNGLCTISRNIPGALTESCFCTRYDIPGVDVDTPVSDPIAPC